MDVTITGRNVKVTAGLRSHIEDKVVKFKKYDPKILEAKVILRVEKFRHIVEISLIAKHMTLTGNGKTNDLYTSIDTAVSKLEVQLKRQRDKIKDKRVRTKALKEEEMILVEEETDIEDYEPRVIRDRKHMIKPMSLEEACMELSISDELTFLVFREQDAMKINVLYKRDDGNYGLIEEN